MAHKKGQGSSRNGRDSNPQYRGLKVGDGQLVSGGSILVRQLGSRYYAGNGVGVGKDWTLFAKADGVVKFHKRLSRKYISVFPLLDVAAPELAAEGAEA